MDQSEEGREGLNQSGEGLDQSKLGLGDHRLYQSGEGLDQEPQESSITTSGMATSGMAWRGSAQLERQAERLPPFVQQETSTIVTSLLTATKVLFIGIYEDVEKEFSKVCLQHSLESRHVVGT